MRPKFQKRSALKFDGRIIPEAKPSGINLGLIPRPLGRKFIWIPLACNETQILETQCTGICKSNYPVKHRAAG